MKDREFVTQDEHERQMGEAGREVARLARGVMAGVHLRLLSGDTNAQYSPTDVARMVSEVIDQQIARLEAEGAA